MAWLLPSSLQPPNPSEEEVADTLTEQGLFPLELVYLMKVGQGDVIEFRETNQLGTGISVLNLEWNVGLGIACREALRARGAPCFATAYERWIWAVRHHWPRAEALRPSRPDQHVLPRGGDVPGPEAFPSPRADEVDCSEPAVVSALTEGGEHPLKHCFALDNLLVRWDPAAAAFHFPVVHDHLLAQACRAYLRSHGAGFETLEDPDSLDDPPHRLTDVLTLAAQRDWENRAALQKRVTDWAARRKADA